ncbi:MAG: hypothetical protein IIB00_09365, partial [candidate division Zixibacteria bacterium]|nr:hypothetical protein [candidate division Zixibacteria bacterium]
MKRFLIFTLAVICAGAFSLNSAQSAVPQLINYQGILTDAVGDPVADDTYMVKFIIWDASAAGNDKWNSGFQNITTVDGLFEYILGSDVALPDDIFEDTIRYLGITVGADAEIMPRTRLVSAGYAYHALRADTAGIAVSVFSNSIGSAEVIDNSFTSADLAANFV